MNLPLDSSYHPGRLDGSGTHGTKDRLEGSLGSKLLNLTLVTEGRLLILGRTGASLYVSLHEFCIGTTCSGCLENGAAKMPA